MAFTLCTSGQAIAKAGANANTDATISGQLLDWYSDMAEGTLNMKTRYDWVANIGSVGANMSGVLADVVSDMIAMKIINYDTSGYLKDEANLMLTVLSDNRDTIIKDLREKQFQEKI